MESLKRTISEGEKAVAQIRTNAKMAKSDEYITNVLSSLAKAYKYQIHSYLRELGTDEAEAEVREHIKYIVKYILPILEARIQKHKMGLKALTAKKLTPVVEVKLGEEKETLRKYLEIYDDYYALVACRSMEHFALYMEFDQPEKDKVWKYNLNCFHGFWYYANKMVLDHEYKMLEKQCPVGYGKCSHPLTNVLTAQGCRLLRDIRVGDLVYAMEDNKPVIRRVTHRWDTRKPQVKIKIRSGIEVICSPEHRLYTDKGYMMCKYITTDDYLYEISQDKTYFVWQQVKSVEYDDTIIDMVDIEVEGAHNFIANGIVSHNSYSDVVMMAFIFGNDINADILKVTGNPQMVADGVEKLVKYMLMPRYAKVFPQFEEYNCDSSQMFTSLERGSTRNPGRFLLRGSKKGCSFLMVNKDTPVDGGRFMWRFYDDITRSKDKANIVAHEKDISMYVSGWKKRKYDDERSFEVFSGTTYNIQDFLSYAKRTHGGDNALPSPINEFTSVNPVFKSVFVCVPKLDKNDNVTFPARYSRQEAIQDRANDYETFMAMEMQTPVPLKGNPFAYGKIQTYSTIPREPSETDVCIAALDPARTGANYVSMPIMEEVNGKYYLKDVVFELRPMAEMYGEIIEKIVKHRIIKLHIERNTDTSLKFLLDKMLHERGINFCEITEVYSTQQKDRKIANAEASIRNGMVFPEFGMYAQSSPMGEFMKWFTGYSYVTKNAFDDSVDSLAIFADKFILGKTKTAKAIVLNMRH